MARSLNSTSKIGKSAPYAFAYIPIALSYYSISHELPLQFITLSAADTSNQMLGPQSFTDDAALGGLFYIAIFFLNLCIISFAVAILIEYFALKSAKRDMWDKDSK